MKCLRVIIGLSFLGILFLNSGCASIDITRNDKGEVTKVEQTGLGKFSVDKDGKVATELAPDWLPTVPIYKD